MAVFNYIMRKVWLQQTRIGLSLYDATGQGLLTEMVVIINNGYFPVNDFFFFLLCPGFRELHNWTYPNITPVGRAWKIIPFFLRMYCRSQVSFLPGSIKAWQSQDTRCSGFRFSGWTVGSKDDWIFCNSLLFVTLKILKIYKLRDEELPKDAQDSNWFSAPSALRVYGQYLNLDTNRNGMLCQEELRR